MHHFASAQEKRCVQPVNVCPVGQARFRPTEGVCVQAVITAWKNATYSEARCALRLELMVGMELAGDGGAGHVPLVGDLPRGAVLEQNGSQGAGAFHPWCFPSGCIPLDPKRVIDLAHRRCLPGSRLPLVRLEL